MYPHGGDVAFISRPVGGTWYRFRQLDPQSIGRVWQHLILSHDETAHLRPRALGAGCSQEGSRIEKASGQLGEAAQDIDVGRVNLHRARDTEFGGGIHNAVWGLKEEVREDADVAAAAFSGPCHDLT